MASAQSLSVTGGLEFERRWPSSDRVSITKAIIELIYENCRIQGFGAWPLLGAKSQEISASAALLYRSAIFEALICFKLTNSYDVSSGYV